MQKFSSGVLVNEINLQMFQEMVSLMKGEYHLLNPKADKLYNQYCSGLSAIQMNHLGQIVGHVTLWPLVEQWYELGTLWTCSNSRNHGVAEELMRAILTKRSLIMLTTTNPAVWRLSSKVGMNNCLFRTLPLKVHTATCICPPDKIKGCINQSSCPLKDNECRCYVSLNMQK